MLDYDCQSCAACCQGLPGMAVPITPLDVEREPRLVAHAPRMAEGVPCPFLDGTRCTIYRSRPDCCRLFVVGGYRCVQTRLRVGLSLIEGAVR
jgi:Fe-S-cluster containining protein